MRVAVSRSLLKLPQFLPGSVSYLRQLTPRLAYPLLIALGSPAIVVV